LAGAIEKRESYAKTLKLTTDEEKQKNEQEKTLKDKLEEAEYNNSDERFSTEQTRKAVSDAKKALSDFQKTKTSLPQQQYAENLKKAPFKILYKNSEAAKKIKDTAGKSKEQKDVDALMNLLKKNSEEKGSSTPPATPPTTKAPKP
jgi:hypothetical protein